MRVGVITQFPRDPEDPCGGVESVSVELLRGLARFEDLELHAITVDPDSAAPATGRWGSITTHRLPASTERVLTNAIGSGRKEMQRYLSGLALDVAHSHDFYGLMVAGLPVPRAFTIHGFIHEDTRVAGGASAWLRSKLWKWAELRGWAEQPHIIAISPYVRERLTRIATGVIHDIDNPVGETFFRLVREEVPGRVFAGVGGITPRKNVLGLLRGFSELLADGCEAELRITGGAGDRAYYQEVLEFVRQRKLEDRVKLLGRVSFRQICEELRRASVSVLVSLEENSPMSIEEAMAAGVPVVASNRCGIPYLVRDGESGFLVNPDDPADIAWRLAQLLGDDELRARMGRKAKDIAADRFHPDRVAARTREVYLRAIRDHKRNGQHATR